MVTSRDERVVAGTLWVAAAIKVDCDWVDAEGMAEDR